MNTRRRNRMVVRLGLVGCLGTGLLPGPLGHQPAVASAATITLGFAPILVDGPDLDRRAEEDARIAAATDEIQRAEARLAAADAAIRLDLPPRLRTRLWWTPIPPELAGRAAEVAARARNLADATFTDLLASTHPAVDRLQARSTVIRAVANGLADRVAPPDDRSWTTRLARIRTDAGDGPDRTSELDGPTLLVLAAAALADADAGPAVARALHARAGTVPEGIDALEFGLIESLIDAGGLDPVRRREAIEALLRVPRPVADRLLLGAIHLDAGIESGRPSSTAIADTIRVMLPPRSMNAEDRTRLVRAFADVADAAEPSDADPSKITPITALARLSAITTRADPAEMRSLRTNALIRRATADTSPDIRGEAWLEAATIHMRRAEPEAALEAMLNAIEASPRHPKAELAAGLAMRLAERLEQADEADAAIARLVAALPDHPQRHRWSLARGDRAYAAGERSAAREVWSAIPRSADIGVDAAVRVLRVDAEVLDTRGAERMLTTLDDLDSSIPTTRSDPRRLEADLLRIQALTALERTTSAADIAARFVDPRELPESLRGGLVALVLPALERGGRTAEADRLRAALMELDPTLAARAASDRVRRDFASIFSAVDRDDRAAAASIALRILEDSALSMDVAIEDAGDRPESAVQAGWMLAAAGRHADARRVADAVVASHPDVTEGLFLQAALQGGRIQAPPRTRPAPEESEAASAVRTLIRINGGSPRGSSWWWRSEIEKLEILAALGRDLPRIDARLQRLELEFPNLGGPAFERRARALRASVRGALIRD